MRHILLSRFCAYWPGNKSYDDPDWLSNRFELYKSFNEPSLSAQTNKDFEQVIICDNRLTEEMEDYLSNLPYKTKILKDDKSCWSLFSEYSSNIEEKKIITRFDCDDFLDENYIKILQEEAALLNDNDYIIDLLYINRYEKSTKSLYRHFAKNTSPFASLVCNSGKTDMFHGSHSKIINNYKYIIRKKELKAYLVIHDKNDSSVIKGNKVSNNFNIYE